jgi:hypothetical protein
VKAFRGTPSRIIYKSISGVRSIVQTFNAFVDSTDATDYRYAHRQGGKRAELRAVELSDHLAEMCVKLSAGLGLAFAVSI